MIVDFLQKKLYALDSRIKNLLGYIFTIQIKGETCSSPKPPRGLMASFYFKKNQSRFLYKIETFYLEKVFSL